MSGLFLLFRALIVNDLEKFNFYQKILLKKVFKYYNSVFIFIFISNEQNVD